MQLIHAIRFASRSTRDQLAETLMYFIIAMMTMYIAGRLHMWFFARLIFPVVVFFFMVMMAIYLTRKRNRKGLMIFAALYLSVISWMSCIPSHRLYYAIHLHPFLNADSRVFDFRSWDKYSWLLNVSKLNGAALEANSQASQAVENVLKSGPDETALEFKKRIDQHTFQLEHHQWESYP